jgi:hypothetical protein
LLRENAARFCGSQSQEKPFLTIRSQNGCMRVSPKICSHPLSAGTEPEVRPAAFGGAPFFAAMGSALVRLKIYETPPFGRSGFIAVSATLTLIILSQLHLTASFFNAS